MHIVHPICCGLDVHKRGLVACLLRATPEGGQAELRQFGTTTAEILALADWLRQAGCTHVAMESTGVYWKPVYNLLEEQFTLVVVNPQHVKALRGRKTDRRDAQRLAELLQLDLLPASFIPSAQQREWRDLTRYRTTLVDERSRTLNRLQKVLEDANLKLASVVSDLRGVSAREMMQALLAGETDPAKLAALAQGRLREKRAELEHALYGRFRSHHVFLVAEHLSHLDYLDEAIARVTVELEERLRPFEPIITRLDTIPGVGRDTAQVLLAELGPDLQRFPSAGHLASWAGMCPGQEESGGKRRSGQRRKGSRWLQGALGNAARGAARKRGCYLAAQYHRLARRRGKRRALVAVGHSILVICYYVITRGVAYHELGEHYFDERERERTERALIRRLERLGNQVTVTRL